MNKKKNTCNFCGRNESEVRQMITGLNGYICEDCARQAYDIVCAQGFGPEGAKKADDKSSGYDKVWKDSDRNYWMTAEEAKEYGMIDQVLVKK